MSTYKVTFVMIHDAGPVWVSNVPEQQAKKIAKRFFNGGTERVELSPAGGEGSAVVDLSRVMAVALEKE